MFQSATIVRTKLTPPRPHRYTLQRPRLTTRLREAEAYRLTMVQANTGYGKSTAVAALAHEGARLVWYHLTPEDTDPHVFLLHLIHGFAQELENFSEAPLAQLERWEHNESAAAGTAVVDSLINELAHGITEPLFLVLDDAHLLNTADETLRLLGRLINHAPHDLHPLLITRYPMELPHQVHWRVRGELLEIGQDELAFTRDEIAELFHNHYGLSLTAEQIDLLATRIEGWPIALPLVWQRLQRDKNDTTALPEALGQLSGTASDLFTYLAYEVLEQQPAEIQTFLRVTAVLRELTPEACDALRHTNDSDLILRYLHTNGLFIVNLDGGHSRYHHLFHDFLQSQLTPAEKEGMHLRAAAHFHKQQEPEETLYHYLAAQAYPAAAEILTDLGRELVRIGRLDTLHGWLDALPTAVLDNYPSLYVYRGDIERLHSRFDEALEWYKQAETHSRKQADRLAIGQALRGQARVYLDTVNPIKAEQLLKEALRLTDGVENRAGRARLLKLLAENLLNQGDFKQAEAYREQARQLMEDGPSEVELPVRMMLRTGQLTEARLALEKQAAVEEREPVLRPRAHRETQLLLSLVLSLQGEQEAAYRCAVQGTERGIAFNSHFITDVGYSRQGHAHLLAKNHQGYEQARHWFQKAIQLSETLMVPRLKVESFWGLAQAYGFQGDLAMAKQVTNEGLEIAVQCGDEWIASLLRLTLGASYVLAEAYEAAAGWLQQAADTFRECGDTFGEAMSRLWQSLLWHGRGDHTRLKRDLADLLQLVREHDYTFIFQKRTLLGPPEPRSLVPLLIFARDTEIETAYAKQLLLSMGLNPQLETHPGYQLRLQTLGSFRIWCGREELPAGAWRRQKARQLFQLLVTYRQTMLEREQIVDMLWPELDPEGGQRDFKIAYTTLCKVLEPNRDRKAPSAFVVRDGSRYGLRPDGDIWLDAAEFDELVAAGDQQLTKRPLTATETYRQALKLYEGEYLQEFPYEEWSSEERERLLTTYLRTAERLARALSEQGEWEEVIAVCELILARDDCWEQAYRLMMGAFLALGQRPQALRAYQRCVERLDSELGVQPAAATTQLYHKILAQAPQTA